MKKVWVQTIYTPIFDIDKKPIKIVNFTQDITQLEIMQKDSLTGFLIKKNLF